MDEADEQNIATDAEPAATHVEPGMEEVIVRRPGWAFLLWWVVANTVGATIGGFLARTIAGGLLSAGLGYTYDIVSYNILMGLLLGSAIGLVEWLVLRPYISDMGWWVPATTIGWASAFMIGAYAGAGSASYENSILFGMLIGTASSLAQYIALRRLITLAEVWVVVNALAWIVALLTYPEVDDFLERLRLSFFDVIYFINSIIPRSGNVLREGLYALSNVMPLLWIFLVLEITTGLTLIWLLRRTASPTHAHKTLLADDA
jgi:hypothetical protein